MKARNGEIDLFRFVFCVSIVLLHIGNNFSWDPCPNGFIGLQFFFIVSGCLMAKNANNSVCGGVTSDQIPGRTWSFLIKKCKRFYKYYIVAILLRLVWWYLLLSKTSFRDLIKMILKCITTLTLTEVVLNLEDKTLYVAGAWYLSVMMVCMFILYPLLLKFFNYMSMVICPLLSIFVTGWMFKTFDGCLHIYANWTGICRIGILKGLAELSIGVCVFVAATRLKGLYLRSKYKKAFSYMVTLIKYFCYFLAIAYSIGVIEKSFELYIEIYLAIAIMLSFSEIGFCFSETNLTNYLGKITNPIYIFHYVFLGVIAKYTPSIISENFFSYIILLFSLLVSSVLLMYLTDYLFVTLMHIISSFQRIQEGR